MIELPARLVGTGIRIGFGLAESALRRGADLVDSLTNDDDRLEGTTGERQRDDGAFAATPVRVSLDSTRPAEMPDRPVAAPAREPTPAPPFEEPVSEEPVLARSSADQGAEDGAGPELEVAQPWPAYGKMKVSQIADRIASADAATLTVLTLYERQHADRRGVSVAVERRLEELERQAAAG